MATSARVGKFFQGHGMRDIKRALAMEGVANPARPTVAEILPALDRITILQYYTPEERAQIASVAYQSLRLTDLYKSGDPQRAITKTKPRAISAIDFGNNPRITIRYQTFVRIYDEWGNIVAMRQPDIHADRLYTAKQLAAAIQAKIDEMLVRYRFTGENEEGRAIYRTEFEVVSVLRKE